MGRAPCCEKVGLKRGRWTAEEDEVLTKYIQTHGQGSWRSLPKNAGLLRCGKSCRLRWINYLRADLKRGNFTVQEEETIIKLHDSFGNRWSLIAGHLKGRTDNEIKNYWNSHLSRKIYRFRKPSPVIMNATDGGSSSDKPTGHDVSSVDEAVPFPSTPLLEKETFTAAIPRSCQDTVCGETKGVLCFDDIMDDELLQTNGDSTLTELGHNRVAADKRDFGDLTDSCFSANSCFVDDGNLDWDWERVVQWNELCNEGSMFA